MPRRPAEFALIAVLLIGELNELTTVAAAQPLESPAFTRTRAVDAALRQQLKQGYDRSPTLRGLIDRIEVSDWVIFVQAGHCPDKSTLACLLHFVGTIDGALYLRVIVSDRHRHPDNLIATLAHELQHALEVVEAGSVVNRETMQALFRRIGTVRAQSATVVVYETRAAQAVQEEVLLELTTRPRR